MTWPDWVDRECVAVERADRWRSPRDFDAAGPVGTVAGQRVVSFASNDYLGLTQHPDVVAAAHAALDRWGAGSGAARLVVGSRPVHGELEAELASWRGTEAAVLFSTGFAANLGVLATFGGPGVRICSDELNHASIIDGCRLSKAEVSVYRHCDIDHVAALLEGAEGAGGAGGAGRALVVTDSVFSMDGDVAPVAELARLCAARGALLVLDEAHDVLGGQPDLAGASVLRVGTLSKTLGSLGGFVAGPRRFVNLLVNRARSYIFTTASSPADAAAALAALRIVRGPEGAARQERLRSHVGRIAPGHGSPIIPVVLGEEARAVAASAALLKRGLLVPAIRPPTVAPGSSRLRVTLSAAHTEAQVGLLGSALADLVRLGAVAS